VKWPICCYQRGVHGVCGDQERGVIQASTELAGNRKRPSHNICVIAKADNAEPKTRKLLQGRPSGLVFQSASSYGLQNAAANLVIGDHGNRQNQLVADKELQEAARLFGVLFIQKEYLCEDRGVDDVMDGRG
jgi:hypothetical protein